MSTSTSQTPADTFVYDHPTLGSLTGLILPETPDVIKFRAIPYATLPGRFKHSVLRENLDGLSRDFTKPGYASPHNFDMSDINSGGEYPGQEPIETSEFDSLILEVNVPRSHLEGLNKTSENKLPVMTYIHGGGFVLGKIDAQHNTAHMVQHSITISKPIITTAIQYRLGALGFLATPDGGKNFAIWDQRNALVWIQKFIEGFGGDKSLITLFGESAGGYSICCHMLSHPPSPPSSPLFTRVIIMSGVMGPMLTPISEDAAANTFEKICDNLRIQERGEAALEKLRSLDVQTLVSASEEWLSKGNMWSPIEDPTFFRTKVTWDKVFELLAGCEWVNDMMVGNTGFEGLAISSVANSMTPRIFLEILKRDLSEEAAQKVLRAYDVTLDMDQNLFLTSAMRWCGDIVFDGTSLSRLLYSIFTLLTLINRTNPRIYQIRNHQDRQEHISLCIRHTQPFPQRTFLPTSAPLG
jgi:carboxylesterase type B